MPRATPKQAIKAAASYHGMASAKYLYRQAKAGDVYAFDEIESFLPPKLSMPVELLAVEKASHENSRRAVERAKKSGSWMRSPGTR